MPRDGRVLSQRWRVDRDHFLNDNLSGWRGDDGFFDNDFLDDFLDDDLCERRLQACGSNE